MVLERIFRPPSSPLQSTAGKTILTAVTELGALKHVSTVKEYASRFESILPFTHLPESTAIRLFIDGLQPDIQEFVLFFSPSSLPSAICFADLQERYGRKPPESSNKTEDEGKNHLRVQEIDSNQSKMVENDDVVTEDQELYDEFEETTTEKLTDCEEDTEICEQIEEENEIQEAKDSLMKTTDFIKNDVEVINVEIALKQSNSSISKERRRDLDERRFFPTRPLWQLQSCQERKNELGRHNCVPSLLTFANRLEGFFSFIVHQVEKRDFKFLAKFQSDGDFIWHRWKIRINDLVTWNKLDMIISK